MASSNAAMRWRVDTLTCVCISLALQLLIKGVNKMNKRLLEKSRRRQEKGSSFFQVASQMVVSPLAVRKATIALKRDMLSKDLEIRAQLVSRTACPAPHLLPAYMQHLIPSPPSHHEDGPHHPYLSRCP